MDCSACTVLGVSCNGVDLSYPFNDTTIFWPGGEKFKLCMECSVSPQHGYDYAAGVFSCAEHGGTHVDAPFHFAKDGITVDMIPLNDLIGPCRVIDISTKCTQQNPNYTLSVEDILAHESKYGQVEEKTIVLVRTGWSQYWKHGPRAYLGFDEAKDGPYDSESSSLAFPGLSIEACNWFVERKVSAVGLDTASLDPGNSTDFIAHRILLGAGIYGIENVNNNIDLLPPSGFTLIVMPMKLTGGSGAPARVVATLPV
eukprot:CAMPEP_0184979534 /NCGR_PEP_ID=MMETSP1098-20130426/9790_1 /TAXON_ID=89044 /ORGANISM="Spumella elongata, Strain CCAP 955/1" /LENGTH=255 /DNA_ID=CAMNT_0027502855 /DNA_START=25 /DNA_END=792 /DNA_ORIENTATION=-